MKSTPTGKRAFLNRVKNKVSRPAEFTGVCDKPEPKPLFLIMQEYWFNEILSERKNIEYRENTPFYKSRLIKDGKFRNYKTAVLQVGYHKNARRMTIEIEKIILDGDFEIYIKKIIDRNF